SWGEITYKYTLGSFAYDSSYGLTDFFDGIIDEVRIINSPRSSGWIQTEYNNQYNPASFYSFGNAIEVDKNAPSDASYFIHYKII
ncbi:MAG: hypothetical protein ACXADU_14360, partial [Promethearchaeota archaeon]